MKCLRLTHGSKTAKERMVSMPSLPLETFISTKKIKHRQVCSNLNALDPISLAAVQFHLSDLFGKMLALFSLVHTFNVRYLFSFFFPLIQEVRCLIIKTLHRCASIHKLIGHTYRSKSKWLNASLSKQRQSIFF